MKLKPLGARIAVQFKKLEKKQGILIVPNEAPPQFAEVVGLGDLAQPFKIGDLIAIGRYVTHEIEHEGEKYLIVETKDVIARLEKEDAN
jgi:chaperonin GroES